jgi:hypothetical protein
MLNINRVSRTTQLILMTLAWEGLLATTSGCIADDIEETSTAELAVTYSGHDYVFIPGPNTWEQARINCAATGYYLATVNDGFEQAFLIQTIQQSYGTSSGNWYIGLNDRASEGFFVWVNGTSSFRNWYPGQPNNLNNQDCVNIDAANGLWGDGPCSSLLHYACERDF